MKIVIGVLSILFILVSFIYLDRDTDYINEYFPWERDHIDIKKKYIQKFVDNKDNLQYIPYPVYYINMDKNKDRNEFMKKQLLSYTPEFKRIKGYEGFRINNTKHDTVDDISFENAYELTKPEIGCTMSHILSIEKAFNDNAEIAFIVEDDIYLGTGVNLEKIVENAPKGWYILQLVTMGGKPRDLKKFEYINRRDQGFFSTAGYLISREGMKKLLEWFKQGGKYIIKPKDKDQPSGIADSYIYDIYKDHTMAVLPSPFFTVNTNLASTIHDEDTQGHIESSYESIKDLINMKE